ncbi:hypothetical protein KI387_035343 [Taxus chinensis]|uniref:Germin-like protein n=1 Tax=Taxus chinensis TaxID=29808 RepID=A0AA38L061_TAXCH|nr:hypothetical protein KI387_035343 [Taxus chinensis]
MATVPMAYFLAFLLLEAMIIADPDALQDFCVADTSSSTIFMNGFPCLNPKLAASAHFTTSILRRPGNQSGIPFGFRVTLVTPQALPGMNTLGITLARADVAVGGVVPPHTHPRATEIIFVLKGTLTVGFVDTANKFFSAQVKKGDVFVFPKGVIHFSQNIGNKTASMIAAFNSQAPGAPVISLNTFASSPAIPIQVLAKSFQISVTEVAKIRKNLGIGGQVQRRKQGGEAKSQQRELGGEAGVRSGRPLGLYKSQSGTGCIRGLTGYSDRVQIFYQSINVGLV